MMRHEVIIPVIVGNFVALVFLLVAARVASLARYLIGVGFISTGAFNLYYALHAPMLYVTGYGPLAIWPYDQFIYGSFARHTAAFVIAIAVGQCVAGTLVFLPGRWPRLGYAGAIVFLLAITGLGWGSAFPANLIMAAGVSLVYRANPA
jgi:hypothetical protein